MAHGQDADNAQNSGRRIAHNSSSDDDDDMELSHDSVRNYWLESGDETPVSFTVLPYCKEEENRNTAKHVFLDPNTEEYAYLRGIGNHETSLYIKALSWKLELKKDMKPTFFLQTEKNWIKLLKPRKSYEETIQSILTVAHFLNFALNYPDASEEDAWEHVKKLFPEWDGVPSHGDLLLHSPVIQHLISSNQCLAASTALRTIDLGLSVKVSTSVTTKDGHKSSRKRAFTPDGDKDAVDRKDKKIKAEPGGLQSDEDVDGSGEAGEESDAEMNRFKQCGGVDQTGNGEDAKVDQNGDGEDEDVDEAGDLSETVCWICDNGGEVTSCDGPCMRSFHVHKDAQGADDVSCSTLGFSKSKVERMDKFYCPNCEAKVHQCNACGELGRSCESIGAPQEVFLCETAMCGRFYHPTCIAEIILRDHNKSEQSALAESIKKGEGFSCSMHSCWKCGLGEKEERDLQFGICRRCPRVWHRVCLPSTILFDKENDDDERGEDDHTRAWDGLLQNRILIYCNRHPMIAALGTPARSHVKFPTSYTSAPKRTLENNKFEQMENKETLSKIVSLKNRNQDSLKAIVERKVAKTSEGDTNRKESSGTTSTQKKLTKGPPAVFVLKRLGSSVNGDEKLHGSGGIAIQNKSQTASDGIHKLTNESSLHQNLQKSKPPFKKSNIVSNEIRTVVDSIIGKAKATVTIESVLNKYEVPINYRRLNSKSGDKKCSLFKIESITKGMRKAVETLEKGGSMEDAKMKCSPQLIKYLELCKNDLRVYLSPFLYGARYTSYGRHFTKTDKLEQIADRLHVYVEEGDMVVDFCCGSNEFSLLMKEKLDKSGKNCKYRNFDAIQTKNDFNFTKRDWFKVKPEDLVDGSRLIMGLNPPFGVRGALANQFINHALKFKPKLLVFIVPKETERLDRKPEKYDLIWEDPDLLQGKSFYLPGSIDVDDNPLTDWNAVAPPLYLWSRPDWALRHRQVALEKGHISTETNTRFVGMPWIPCQQLHSPLSAPDSIIEKKKTKTEGKKIVKPFLDEKGKMVTSSGATQETSESVCRKSFSKLKDTNRVDSKVLLTNDSITVANEGKPKSDAIGRTSSKLDTKKVTKINPPNNSDDAAYKDTLKFTLTAVNKPISKDSLEKLSSPERTNEADVPSLADQGATHAISLRKEGRKDESSKMKASDEKDYHASRGDARKVDARKPSSWQETTEKTRTSLDSKLDILCKGRKSNDRVDREASSKHGLLSTLDGKSSEKPRNDDLLGGRVSPTRHGRYEASRKRSPVRAERRDERSPDKHRKISSPERSHWRSSSSVVDLDMYSNRDAKNDQEKNYMKVTELQRRGQISPGRRYLQEDPECVKSSYFDHDAMRQETYSVHAVDRHRMGIETSSLRPGVSDAHVYRRKPYGSEYEPVSGQFDKGSAPRRGSLRHNDNYPELPVGDMYIGQMDGYSSRYNAANVLPQQNQSVLPGREWPSVVPQYSLNYGSHVPQPPGNHVIGITEPMLLSSHGLLGARPPTNLSRYPPLSQASLYPHLGQAPPYHPGHGRLGGWIDD